jgi:hypothetical protein
MRWLGISFPPAGKTTWEDKLWRLISDKCYTRSGPNYQMRKAFFALDEDRSGSIAINELGDVLKKWINLDLTEEQLTVVKAKFENGTGEICYKDLCQVIEWRLQYQRLWGVRKSLGQMQGEAHELHRSKSLGPREVSLINENQAEVELHTLLTTPTT